MNDIHINDQLKIDFFRIFLLTNTYKIILICYYYFYLLLSYLICVYMSIIIYELMMLLYD